jgi:hypothetical protein
MGFQHHTTPKKARVQGICDYLKHIGRTGFHNDVFRDQGVSRTSGWRILAQPREQDNRTFHSIFPDTRGRKKKISNEDLATIERFLDNNGHDGRTIPWACLPAAAGLDIDVSAETVRRAVKDVNFRMCPTCPNKYLSPQHKEGRLEYARTMLERYPEPEDWYHVRFSGKSHFGWGPQGRVHVIQRPWERYCPDCIVEKEEPVAKDQKKLHAWAAVGHDFKSDLVWYDVPGSSNGNMSLQVYRDKILEPVVGTWLQEGQSFVLEEENDSGHGGVNKPNIVRTWKRDHGLETFFNCSSSPDFTPIEKAWQLPKQYIRKRPCWEDDSVRGLAEEGWENLTHESINRWVDDIPQVFKDCIELEGAMTDH